ncbi:DUF4446 family protein [Paenibacillus oenotherae]|uniref:DUF4446 family protein n=1 Tax=Paenibacillus oenotherae TaxID=1435645 RepID=A0ABS7D6S1_9BACL|nr:DUF4446 family protein [Paenibacillus oenotherae]MBW7475639.1 DUF4446 family protein [Paenibacillus oenotherae]
MEEFIQRPIDGVTIGLVIIVLLLVIRTMLLKSKLKKLGRSYAQFMSGTGVDDLDRVIIEIKDRLSQQEQAQHKLRETVEAMGLLLKQKRGNVGIHRYNAFAERGNDLSFSIAVVNDNEDGMVLSGLHSREQTFVYAKPLKAGQSEYPLTPEEKQAITLASQQESTGGRSSR